ncbi:hexose carrier protein, putative [Talaromyces stipitatus ATCC 10500]|uniref:Hexose carrier protein, putative n=1 Tax=Talaromyces stipitatus (strain ATCC 10500 / CBS 375.48 / QM 6759 / NRRL 1006) TaxID=441959 RepID=B8MBJ0_TALSN|nr:hexose carrier protein, putative [Talaromyces stipitatus ATCC 10500]EED17854.1 hexose carrier protein, putative [Talaromyces stipitatus ATCC 10500]
MLKRSPTGTWMPAWVPESTTTVAALLMICSMVQSATGGYDGSMMNGLNILPSYTEYFNLNAATTGLNTASVFIGSFFGTLCSGVLSDWLGRRSTLLWGSVVTLVGIVLQTAAQDIAMFVISRIILGLGLAISGTAGGVYLAETFPSRWRAWGVGLLNDFYYVGALIAAGITLGTGEWNSTWAWRAPSLFQGIFSLACIIIIPFIPESPRWLVHQGLHDLAREVVAQTNSNGNQSDPVALAVYKEILDTLNWEKRQGRTMSPKELIKTPTARKRMLIGISPGPFSCIAGNIIASYYLGSELDTAGIKDTVEQLKANVVLNAWCLVCALTGTHLAAKWGRKPTAILSQVLLIACLFIIGGLSKMYADNPDGASNALVYGDVAVMFLFQGFYSIAWTPLLYLYPPEVMNYSIRANGVALSAFSLNAFALVFVYIMPIGLANIGWKMYMINGSWDIVILILIIVYWVETKGRTLEEIDAIFEGEKHSSVPDVELLRKGKEHIDVGEVEQQIVAEVLATKME